MAPVTHLVLFQFKADITAAVVAGTMTDMLNLKDKCIHPETGRPYIRSLTGGKDNSPEGRQDGITHAFVVEFESEEDRDYYVGKDPAHLAFVQNNGQHLTKAVVTDFSAGVF
ncbi:hypothetical protein N3K66_003781 [Trichothecium roseum]|uniref:Uncharacterized protein n=1 Tax=Trichothecium roseum TaxID=47278 RepID=A0ACC0V7Y4_9HYPO|nr:hypothetical protein N3K66_003781 [Trichothecium roseum]